VAPLGYVGWLHCTKMMLTIMRILVGLRRALPQRAHGSCIPNRGGWGIVLAVILGLKHWMNLICWLGGG